ncbi:TPA: toxin-antitoxin system HicB family antitoxin [Salmonella enterica]|nr:toxin-antitoxin system HicB family antitoxin [Salmonella enterica]
MSTIRRDKKPGKGTGNSPTFQIRISPELKAQFEAAAAMAGMSLGNWLKTLGREALKKQGIEPEG